MPHWHGWAGPNKPRSNLWFLSINGAGIALFAPDPNALTFCEITDRRPSFGNFISQTCHFHENKCRSKLVLRRMITS
jgi:hypothetical protein